MTTAAQTAGFQQWHQQQQQISSQSICSSDLSHVVKQTGHGELGLRTACFLRRRRGQRLLRQGRACTLPLMRPAVRRPPEGEVAGAPIRAEPLPHLELRLAGAALPAGQALSRAAARLGVPPLLLLRGPAHGQEGGQSGQQQ